MSTILRSTLVLLTLLGAARSALAFPEHTIYVDMSHSQNTDSGMIDADCEDADQNAR